MAKTEKSPDGKSVTNASLDGLKAREKVLLAWDDELATELGNQYWYQRKSELYDSEEYEYLLEEYEQTIGSVQISVSKFIAFRFAPT